MDVFSIARACFRRWYIFLLILGVTGVACYTQIQQAKPTYSRGASMLVAAPRQTTPGAVPYNPLSNTSGALQALIEKMNSVDVTADVYTVDPSSVISAVAGPKGPIIKLGVMGSSSAGTAKALARLSQDAVKALDVLQQQAGASTDGYFKLILLKPDGGADATYPSRARNVGLVGVSGLLLAIILSEIVDAIALRRRARKRRKLETADQQTRTATRTPADFESAADLTESLLTRPEPAAGRSGSHADHAEVGLPMQRATDDDARRSERPELTAALPRR